MYQCFFFFFCWHDVGQNVLFVTHIISYFKTKFKKIHVYYLVCFFVSLYELAWLPVEDFVRQKLTKHFMNSLDETGLVVLHSFNNLNCVFIHMRVSCLNTFTCLNECSLPYVCVCVCQWCNSRRLSV